MKNKNMDTKDITFTYDDLFKAFVAGDTEGMRRSDEVDMMEFEEWFKMNYRSLWLLKKKLHKDRL